MMGCGGKLLAFLADKAAVYRSLVAKLQKTQRAAEQALDKFGFFIPVVVCASDHPMQIDIPGMRRRVQNRWGAASDVWE